MAKQPEDRRPPTRKTPLLESLLLFVVWFAIGACIAMAVAMPFDNERVTEASHVIAPLVGLLSGWLARRAM